MEQRAPADEVLRNLKRTLEGCLTAFDAAMDHVDVPFILDTVIDVEGELEVSLYKNI